MIEVEGRICAAFLICISISISCFASSTRRFWEDLSLPGAFAPDAPTSIRTVPKPTEQNVTSAVAQSSDRGANQRIGFSDCRTGPATPWRNGDSRSLYLWWCTISFEQLILLKENGQSVFFERLQAYLV